MPTTLGATNQVFTGKSTADPNAGAAGVDKYTMYKGDGSAGSGWPDQSKWVSFDAM